MRSNVSGPHRTSGFKFDPAMTELENDNSVEAFNGLPIVPRGSSDHLNGPVLNCDTIGLEPFDKWMRHNPFLKASSDPGPSSVLNITAV